MKKNLYMVQVNASFDNSVYLPYAAGALVACAMKNDKLKQNYSFKEIMYMRRDIETVLTELDNPSVIAFSNYIWNYEYNKALAEKVKKAYPSCYVVFGGHNIPQNTSVLEELPYVDILSFGEGEKTFCDILLCLCENENLSSVFNIAYRNENGEAVCTQRRQYTDIDYPSPYEMGVFDTIVKNASGSFSAILETNRGCPYSCAFCDWGYLKSKIRQFPMQRVLNDLKWMADNKIEYCYCADSNFGIFERDSQIIDYVIKLYKENGYPQKFRVNYMKNSDDKVFEINHKLYEAGMSKGVTLSFQSMCDETLKIIGRKNISTEYFRELLMKYKKTGLSAYTELILGLPGETYESFKDGIEKLLEAGQHSSIFIYNCELLLNSRIGQPDFCDKYEIETARIPFNQDHFAPVSESVQEYSNIVISTSSMKRSDWIRSATLSVFIQAFHCLGLLQCAAIYLYYEKNIPYTDFYCRFLDILCEDKGLFGKIYNDTVEKITEYSEGNSRWAICDDKFGNISWPVEEGIFLKYESDYEAFYEFAKGFVSEYIDDNELSDELIRFQRFILKKHTDNNEPVSFKYDFFRYFSRININEYEVLKKTNCLYAKRDAGYNGIDAYAKEVIWFGRRNSSTLSSDIVVK